MVESLKIGPTTFAVSEVAGLIAGGETVWGDASLGESTIRVEDTLAPSPRRTTLLHEVVHVVLHHAGCREAARDEGVVGALSHGLLQVLRDNPGFVEVLCEE